MKNRCQLCGGKIVNGKCSDCGMDYTRRREEYRLNETRRSPGEETAAKKSPETGAQFVKGEAQSARRPQNPGNIFSEVRKQYDVSRRTVAEARKSQKLSWAVSILILLLVLICMALGYTQ